MDEEKEKGKREGEKREREKKKPITDPREIIRFHV